MANCYLNLYSSKNNKNKTKIVNLILKYLKKTYLTFPKEKINIIYCSNTKIILLTNKNTF